MKTSLAALGGVLTLLGAATAHAGGIRGDYVEARTADVFTGPCFSNSEAFTTGNQAVMAWKVTEGSYQGVDLAGLTVAAAVAGSTTLTLDKPEQAVAVLIVDEEADGRQRDALVALARSLGGVRLDRIAGVRTARMRLNIERRHASTAEAEASSPEARRHHGSPQAPRASFWAAGLAQIVTRPLDGGDHFCGNEVVAYEPLSRGVDVLPAYTLGHQFKGTGLNTSWDDPNCRSSFVGRFAL